MSRSTDIANLVKTAARGAGFDLAGVAPVQDFDELDQFRKWNSLDDKRYCFWCSKIITGYEIKVIGGTRGTGQLRISCPTKGCHSIPMDWALPTDEALSKYRGAARLSPVLASASS